MPLKPKIAYVVSQLDVGGCEVHLSEVLPHLSQWYDIQVFVFSNQRGVLGEYLSNHGIRVRCLLNDTTAAKGTILRFVYAAVALARELRQGFDIIHSFLPAAYCVMGFAYFLSVPVKYWVMSRRSLNFYARNKWGLRAFEKFLHRKVIHLALGNSSAVSKQLIEEGVAPTKVRTIFNGLPQMKRTAEEIDLDALVPQGWTRIVYVANLFEYKGQQELVQVAEILLQKGYTRFCFILAGKDRGAQKALEARIQSRGLGAHFLWLGLVTNTHALLSQVNWAVFPSYQEGFSNSLLEKMSYGLPIVATDVGGNTDAIEDGHSGFLVPPYRGDLLAEKLVQFFMDPALAQSMGENAKARVASHFTLERCVAQYRQVYDELLAGKFSQQG